MTGEGASRRWEHTDADGTDARVVVDAHGVAVSTRRVSGERAGEVFGLDALDEAMPWIESHFSPEVCDEVRAAAGEMRALAQALDDEVP